MFRFILAGAVWLMFTDTFAMATYVDPLCYGKICSPLEECRVVEECDPEICTFVGRCVDKEKSNHIAHGCDYGKPVLVLEPYCMARTCSLAYPCPYGFYCTDGSSEEQNTQMCCRTHSAAD